MKTPTDAELKALLPTKQLERNKEPKVQVWLTQKDALEFARAVLAKWGQPQAVAGGEPVKRVFIVATGDEHEGEATYTRYDDAPPPLCDSECLYTAPPPQAVREPRAEWALQALVAAGFVAQVKVDEALALYDSITKGGQHDPA